MFDVTNEMLIMRLLVCGGLTLNTIAVVLAFLGSDFTRFYENDPQFKINLLRVSILRGYRRVFHFSIEYDLPVRYADYKGIFRNFNIDT